MIKLHEILNFPQITNKIKQTSIEIFCKLLEDSEAEVKNICCLRLEEMTKVLYKEDKFFLSLGRKKRMILFFLFF